MNIAETLSVQIIDQLRQQRNEQNETKQKTQLFFRQILSPILKENEIINDYEKTLRR